MAKTASRELVRPYDSWGRGLLVAFFIFAFVLPASALVGFLSGNSSTPSS